MIFRLFELISKKTSFTFAAIFFSMPWAWIGAFYGLFFYYGIVDFITHRFYISIIITIILVAVNNIFHSIYFGLFPSITPSRKNKFINKYLHDDFIFLNQNKIDHKIIENLYKKIIILPRRILKVILLSTVVIVACVLIIYYFINPERLTFVTLRIPYIITACFISMIIIGYFSFNITEYLIGPTKIKIEEVLFHKIKNFKSIHLTNFKLKSIFILLLILFSMIIQTIFIKNSNRSVIYLLVFILFSVSSIGFLIYLSINSINLALKRINSSTKKLAAGKSSLYFPTFADKELVIFSNNYNIAAKEINDLRSNLENKIVGRTIELKTAYDNLNKAYTQIQDDLLLAKKIQKSILPENFDKINGIDVSVHYYPMQEIGGDIYDIDELYPGYIRIFLADAIGHGIQASLVTMIIKSEYEKVKYDEKISSLLNNLNNSFIDIYESLSVFFTCILIDIDIKNNRLIYSSAGHPDQIIILNNEIDTLSHMGKLIGVKKDLQYKINEKNITHNDKLLLFSDGLFEEYNIHGEEFGENNVKKIIEQMMNSKIDVICGEITSNLSQFIGNNDKISINDDITLIGVAIK